MSFILRSLYPALAGGALAGQASCFDTSVVTHDHLTIDPNHKNRKPNCQG
ncbi:MAG: hypothetical protein KGZ49_05120 [Syntrophaceae bacterium]|nr:hypothetical protein [Syntrophaceae bacterium]